MNNNHTYSFIYSKKDSINNKDLCINNFLSKSILDERTCSVLFIQNKNSNKLKDLDLTKDNFIGSKYNKLNNNNNNNNNSFEINNSPKANEIRDSFITNNFILSSNIYNQYNTKEVLNKSIIYNNNKALENLNNICIDNKMLYFKSKDTGEVFLLQNNQSLVIENDIEEWFRIIDTKKYLKNKLLEHCLNNNINSIKKMFDSKLSDDKKPILNYVDEYDKDTNLIILIIKNFINIDILEFLINEGCNYNFNDSIGNTPLHYAAKNNNYLAAELLLSMGSSCMVKNNEGYTPLHYAALNGNLEVINILLTQPINQIYCLNMYNERPIDISCNLKTYNILLEYEVEQNLNANLIKLNKNNNSINSNKTNSKTNNAIIHYNNCYKRHILNNKTLLHNSRIDYLKTILYKDNMISKKIAKNITELGINIMPGLSLHNFKFLTFLGKGSFGEVHLVENIDKVKTKNEIYINNEVTLKFISFKTEKKKTKNLYALKAIKKDLIIKQGIVRYIIEEKNILEQVDNPFIVKIYNTFQTNNFLYIVLQYCPNKDLNFHLKYEKTFNEEKIKYIAAQIIIALEYLHDKNIVYRDLKPENIVIDEDGFILLTDFGLAKKDISYNNFTYSFCGSLAYLSPEVVIRKGYNLLVDWYMLGVVLYEMVHGNPPFLTEGITRENLLYNIQHCTLFMKQDGISDDLRDLIDKLLIKNANDRLGSGFLKSLEIKAHPFFKDINWDDILNK